MTISSLTDEATAHKPEKKVVKGLYNPGVQPPPLALPPPPQ
jgi:hypothetical protein